MSLFESAFRLTDCMALEYDTLKHVRERNGSESHAAPHNHCPIGSGAWIAIACASDRIFRRLTHATHEPECGEDPAFATTNRCTARRGEVDRRVAASTSAASLGALRTVLDGAEAPEGAGQQRCRMLKDPQFAARGTLPAGRQIERSPDDQEISAPSPEQLHLSPSACLLPESDQQVQGASPSHRMTPRS